MFRIRKETYPHLFCFFILLSLFLYLMPLPGNTDNKTGKLIIKDYRRHLNSKFKKERRTSTRYIIVHTSEAGLSSTLRTLSKGKKTGKNYRTVGGHAHYVIARDGKVYRILNHFYRADHAGLSMWDGLSDLSSYSVGIELVGYHYDEITKEQYQSLSLLLDELQSIYDIPDKNVLAHCQISYGKPNRWFKQSHRGRKRCALNFDRRRAGLEGFWSYDPDVKSGRLAADRQIKKMFYSKEALAALRARPVVKEKPGLQVGQKTPVEPVIQTEPRSDISNIIGPDNTAWNIAGEDYDKPETLYVLPGKEKRTVSGDLVEHLVGWDKLPIGTQVLLNHPVSEEEPKGPIFEINKEYTAWTFAGAAYRSPSTIYFLPRKKNNILPGNQIRDWDSLPKGTKLIIGYRGPYLIRTKKGKTAWGIAGKSFNDKETIYYIPGKSLVTGDKVKDFGSLPRGSKIFLKE